MKTILFRFSIGISAFLLGIAFFSGFYWIQIKSETPKLETAQTIINKETFVIPPPQESLETEDSYSEIPSFEDGGYFYIIKTPNNDLVKHPKKAFSEFTEFHIELWDYDEKKGELFMIPPSGYVDAKQTFKFKRVFLGKQNITFETEKVNGISYQFNGKLVDKIDTQETEPVYLIGNLIKFKNGKKVADGNFEFSWYQDGC